jgi:RHS repeat-associated protein
VNDTTLIQRSTTTSLVSQLETPAHQVWRVTYDARGNLLTATDTTHEGHGTGGFQAATTKYTYHDTRAPDSPDSIIDPDSVVTRFVYNTLGLDSLAIAPTGQQTRFLYGADTLVGQLVSVTDLQVRTYSDTTNWSTSTSLVEQTTSFSYDPRGNVATTTSPRGHVTAYHYNASALVDTVINPLSQRTVYYYQTLGVVDSITQLGAPSNRTVRFGYDAALNRITVSDPRNVTRTWRFDAADRDTAETDDYQATERRFLGPSGLADSVLTRRNALVRYTYDPAGRPTQTRFPTVTTLRALGDTITMSYDASSRMLSATNRNGSVNRQYYREGTVKQDSSYSNVDAGYRVVARMRYTKADQRSQYLDFWAGGSDTLKLSYSYVAGLVQQLVIDYPGAAPGNDTATYTWDGLGRRQQLVTPHHATVGWYYDLDGRLRRVASTHACVPTCAGNDSAVVDVRIGSYDRLDRPLHISQSAWVQTTVDTMAYTEHGEMAFQIHDGIRRDMTYDSSGNLRSSLEPSHLGFIYVMQPGHNRLATDSLCPVAPTACALYAAHSYSAAGDRTYDSTAGANVGGYRQMWYDALGRMTSLGSISTASAAGPQDVSATTPTALENDADGGDMLYTIQTDACRYDALGRRIKACGGLPMAFDGTHVVRVAGTRIIYGPGDEPLAVYDSLTAYYNPSGSRYYFLTDGEGRLLSFTDRAGNDARMQYNSVYRDRAILAGAMALGRTFGVSAAEANTTPELAFFANRYYDQRTGRWTQEDPIGVAGGVNLYAYVGNNPSTFTDPFGLCPVGLSVLDALLCSSIEATTTFLGSLAGFVVGGGGSALVAVATGGVTAPAVPSAAWSGVAFGAAAGLTLGRRLGNTLFSQSEATGSGDSDAPQHHRLSPGEIRRLQAGGVDPHDLKPSSGFDLFKDPDGNILVKPKSGQGPGESTGLNIYDYLRR